MTTNKMYILPCHCKKKSTFNEKEVFMANPYFNNN